MAPEVLHRVIHGQATPEKWQKDLLKIRPAVLHGYRRHRVRGADYPGIIPVSSPDESSRTSVLGTLVSGITDGDIYRLDKFEGSEYSRERVRVRTLRDSALLGTSAGQNAKEFETNEQLREVLDIAGKESLDEGDEVEAVTYVWTAGEERLEDAEWDFGTFKRDKMAWWVGADESEW